MRCTYYTYNRIHEDSYEDNVEWLNSQYEKYGDRIVFAVRGNRFARIRPTKFHYVYGSIDIVPADTNLVYIHSCRTRYRTTLQLQGIYW